MLGNIGIHLRSLYREFYIQHSNILPHQTHIFDSQKLSYMHLKLCMCYFTICIPLCKLCSCETTSNIDSITDCKWNIRFSHSIDIFIDTLSIGFLSLNLASIARSLQDRAYIGWFWLKNIFNCKQCNLINFDIQRSCFHNLYCSSIVLTRRILWV